MDVKGTMHFPGFSEECSNFLIKNRSINAIGIDTLSLDSGNSTNFLTHQIILKSDHYQIENMKLDEVPEHGALIIALPLKLFGAPESPTRVIALVRSES